MSADESVRGTSVFAIDPYDDSTTAEMRVAGTGNEVAYPAAHDFDECLNRLQGYHQQIQDADQRADANSLERAADVVALYEARHWVTELPEVKQRRTRGRPVEVDSWSRFAHWLNDQTGLAPSTIYQLRRAHEIRTTYLRQAEISLAGERALRPLQPMEKEHPEAIRVIWDDAVERCAGVPDSTAVKAAVKRWKEENLPKRSRLELRHRRMAKDCRRRIIADVQTLIARNQTAELFATLDEVQRLTADLERPS